MRIGIHGRVQQLHGRRAWQALDDLMRMLLVVHRLLEAEERLAQREWRADLM
jgi:hypothetical protein